MKHLVLLAGISLTVLFFYTSTVRKVYLLHNTVTNLVVSRTMASDTCIIEGHTFKMLDYKSARKLKAYIKNGQIYVESKGLQYAKFRITYYIFSSLDDEQMPVIRSFDQRLSQPVLEVLKNAVVGSQFIIEEIVVIDPSKKELTNAVRPILLERIKN